MGKNLELQGFPDASAIGAVAAFAVLRLYFVSRQIAYFGLYGDVLGLAAHAQFIDTAAAVFHTDAFNALVVLVGLLLLLLQLLRRLCIGLGRFFAIVLCHGRGHDQARGKEEGGCAHAAIVVSVAQQAVCNPSMRPVLGGVWRLCKTMRIPVQAHGRHNWPL